MRVMAGAPATYGDLLALPENMLGQILGGELVATPRPANRHSLTASTLTAELVGPFSLGRGGGPGGWWILDEPELHLGKDILVPDLAGWRRDRLPEVPDEPFFTLAPDWICEILSPSTAGIDRVRKMPIFARERVGHAWLIDPAAMTFEVFRREGDRWLLLAAFGGDELARAEPFEAIELPLGSLWPSASPVTGR